MNAVAFVLWVFGAFLIGALPLSVWVGSLALGVDVRAFGDGNPGATNVYRAGGRMTAFFALFLDFLKGALPVGTAAYVAGINFPLLAAISLAPVAGHAFSPFLRWRGGKAVAVTFGIWAGLTAGRDRLSWVLDCLLVQNSSGQTAGRYWLLYCY